MDNYMVKFVTPFSPGLEKKKKKFSFQILDTFMLGHSMLNQSLKGKHPSLSDFHETWYVLSVDMSTLTNFFVKILISFRNTAFYFI